MQSSGASDWIDAGTLERLPSFELFRASHKHTKQVLLGSALASKSPLPTSSLKVIQALKALDLKATLRIATLIDAYNDSNLVKLVYDLPSLPSLYSELEFRVFTPKEGFDIAYQIALSLGELHQLGKIHGKLSVESVLLKSKPGEDSEIRLINWGIAPLWTDPSPSDLWYLDPCLESFLNRDVRSDIYAFGILLYRLSTGTFPFPAESLDQVRTRARELPPPLGKRATSWPAQTFDIVKQCTDLKPTNRILDVSELLNSLKRLAPLVGASVAQTSKRHIIKGSSNQSTTKKGIVVVPGKPSLKSIVLKVFVVLIALLAAAFYYRDDIFASSQYQRLLHLKSEGLVSLFKPRAIPLSEIPTGEYLGTIETPSAKLPFTATRTKAALRITPPWCKTVSVEPETGFFSCDGDSLIEVSGLKENALSGLVRHSGKDFPYTLKKIK